MSEYVDMAGQEMKAGDYIVYSAAAGRAGVMKMGRIVELAQRKDRWRPGKTYPVVKAVSVDQWRSWSGGLQNGGRPVTLGLFDRILVVSAVPAVANRFEKCKQDGESKIAERAARE